jgi:hypothetical protein
VEYVKREHLNRFVNNKICKRKLVRSIFIIGLVHDKFLPKEYHCREFDFLEQQLGYYRIAFCLTINLMHLFATSPNAA